MSLAQLSPSLFIYIVKFSFIPWLLWLSLVWLDLVYLAMVWYGLPCYTLFGYLPIFYMTGFGKYVDELRNQVIAKDPTLEQIIRTSIIENCQGESVDGNRAAFT